VEPLSKKWAVCSWCSKEEARHGGMVLGSVEARRSKMMMSSDDEERKRQSERKREKSSVDS
jgi:hypothetical protein